MAAVAAALGLAAMVVAAALAFRWDAGAIAIWVAILAVVGALAFRWGRWKAVLWLGVVPWAGASLLADFLWYSGAWNRSASEYEPLPLSMFVLPLGVPALAAAAALGVAVRRAM
jgi:hypothetical protein